MAINRIADLNALELIAVLDARRNSAAIRAARRIEREARKAPHEPRSDVELDHHALGELIEVLSEARWEGDFPDVAHLRDHASTAFARGEWAQEDS